MKRPVIAGHVLFAVVLGVILHAASLFSFAPLSLLPIVSQFIPSQVSAQTAPRLKVLSYNTFGENWDRDYNIRRMEDLADYIVRNQVDVASLQEMVSDYEIRSETRGFNLAGDPIRLQQLLAERNYPVEIHYPRPADTRQHFQTVIVSRYPMVASSKTTFPQSDGSDRHVPVVDINTPLGLVTVMGIHTRYGSTVCSSLDIVKNKIDTTYAGKRNRMLVMGDYNAYFNQDCWERNFEQYTSLCGSSSNNFCRQDTVIDFILSPSQTDFVQVSGGFDGSKGMSDHRPILSTIGLKSGVNPPNPVPQPIAATAPAPVTPPQTDRVTAPSTLQGTCQVNPAKEMRSEIKLTWNAVSGAQRYLIRMDRRNTCTSSAGQTVSWYCPQSADGFGDVAAYVSATTCTGGTCTAVIPVANTADYDSWRVQTIMPGGTGNLDQGGVSATQPAFKCNFVKPLVRDNQNIWPWHNNGPTSAWTSMSNHISYFCTGTLCWRYNNQTNTWLSGGTPRELSTLWAQAMPPANSTGARPTTGAGPTAAWEEYRTGSTYFNFGRSFLWVWENNYNNWAGRWRPGTPLNISSASTPGWNQLVAAPGNIMPWSGNGITASWTDKVRGRQTLCNTKHCWIFDYTAGGWANQNSAGRGQSYDISTSWDVGATSSGVYPWSNNGPTAGWTNDVSDMTYMCNGRYCWQYRTRALSATQPVGWHNSGRPIDLCATWAGAGATCGTQITQADPLPVPPPPPPAPPIPPILNGQSLYVYPESVAGRLIWPWYNNGPTSAWTSAANHKTYICNQDLCWRFDSQTSRWDNTGRPQSLLRWWQGATPPANPSGGRVDVSGGPTAAWEQYQSNTTYFAATSNFMWVWENAFNNGAGRWRPGTPLNLSDRNTAGWNQVGPTAQGVYPWSGQGITAAWTDPARGRQTLCNGKYCWIFDYTAGDWVNKNTAGRAQPYDLSTSWATENLTAAAGSIFPWSGAGPTAGWTSDTSGIVYICNGQSCWQYRTRALSTTQPVGWHNGGRPIDLCRTWSEPGTTCPTPTLPTVPEPEPQDPEPEVPENPAPDPEPQCHITADVDRSDNRRRVDYLDAQWVITNYGKTGTGKNIVGDDIIDLFDYNQVIRELGEECSVLDE